MILLLIVAGVLYSVLGSFINALTIIIIILLVMVEVWNEYRVKRSISALRQLSPQTALVVRTGQSMVGRLLLWFQGDVLALKVGQRIPADARLLEAIG